MNKELFTCSSCKRTYRFFMRGGTHKMIGDPVRYADEHTTECCYCHGTYADGTICNGGRNKK